MSAAVWSWPGWFPQPTRTERRQGHSSAEPCDDCGLPHTPERRLAILRRCEGMAPAAIAEAYPHIWPCLSGRGGRWGNTPGVDTDSAGHKLLMRDLATLRRWA